MDLDNYQTMDPHLLYGVINTILRNHCEDLEDLCHVHSIDRNLLEKRLLDSGYEYNADLNQFR